MTGAFLRGVARSEAASWVAKIQADQADGPLLALTRHTLQCPSRLHLALSPSLPHVAAFLLMMASAMALPQEPPFRRPARYQHVGTGHFDAGSRTQTCILARLVSSSGP
jgi:hypothetical protein